MKDPSMILTRTTTRRCEQFPEYLRCLLVVCCLLSPVAQARSEGGGPIDLEWTFQAAEALEHHALRCPWSDCRGCDQYRRICGGVVRDLSALEVQLMMADGGYDGDRTQSSNRSPGNGTDDFNIQEITGGQATDEADLNKSADSELAQSGRAPLARTFNHQASGSPSDARSIPTLSDFMLVSLGITLLLAGLAVLRSRAASRAIENSVPSGR